MTPFPSSYRLSGRLLEALARGGGGAEAVRLLENSEYSRRLVLLRAVLDRAREHGGSTGAGVGRLFGVLTDAWRRAPDVTRFVLGHPSVGPRLVTTWQALDVPEPDPVVHLPLSSVAAATAVATGVEASVALTASGPGVVLPGLGALRVPRLGAGAEVRLRSRAAGGVVETVTGTRTGIPPASALRVERAGWWPLREAATRPGGPVLIDDVDPVASTGATPRGLSAGELRAWRSGTTAALRLLRLRHTGYATELDTVLRTLVPAPAVTGVATRRSGSSAEMFGGVELSRPATEQDFAESLVHETQHSKLAAVMHLVDLLADPGPAAPAVHYAPWRDDPRPLLGLLHGTYAFLSVARFWAQEVGSVTGAAQRHEAQVRCARWRDAATETAYVMLAADRELTPAGHVFVAAMAQALADLRAVPLPASAVREARRQAERHLRRWRERNPALATGG
ncbi:HEXXH motif domain-containing protein [Streptomyces sp. NPDC086549]|uniref:HEXXH motif domain-containing protein n=1 Tax=Streptomyces sp. NPDC086549 TaxID=3365752 RepID=UPI0038270955